ncbi:MAG: thiamine phosphate synthase [Janthinobacterium lividum]
MKGLYLVTPDLDDTARLCEHTEQALLGGAALLQYRHKMASPAQRLEQAGALLALCRRHGVPLIINDHVDLCLALDADGIHVGGTDLNVATVRALVGPQKIVGASCYGSLELAWKAAEGGASYIALGGFYPSRVKKYPVTTPVQLITQVQREIGLPLVVIGGMTVDNAAVLVEAGADMVAAISSVYGAADVLHAAREFAGLFGN